MRRFASLLAWVLLIGAPASAQIGDLHDLTGGVMFFHSPPGLVFTVDVPTFCPYFNLTDCQDQVVDQPCTSYNGKVFFLVSQFYEPKAFSRVEYGLSFTGTSGGYIPFSEGHCLPGDVLVEGGYPQTAWPQSGTGVALMLQEGEWTSDLQPTHYIAAYFYCGYGPAELEYTANPATGSIGWTSAGQLWTPADTGTLGIDMPGKAVCSVPPAACCLPEGSCLMLLEDDCLAQGGECQGDDCAPDLCAGTADVPEQAPSTRSTWGRLKSFYK